MKKVKIYMGVPTTGTLFDSHVHALRELEKKYKDEVELVYPEVLVRRKFHDFARNCIVDEFLATDCDLLWFVDSDVAPPSNILDLVTVHGDYWKLAGAPYPVFMTPPGEKNPQLVYTVYTQVNGRMHPKKIPYKGLDYVEGVATGCLMIKREVLEKLEKPYFQFKYNAETMHIEEGEDLGFCRKVSDLNYKFFIDYSMVCKHQKELCLLEVNNYTIEYANKSVLAYDRAIRPQIAALETQLRGKMSSVALSKPKIILPEDLR